jgi:hypothetical protein
MRIRFGALLALALLVSIFAMPERSWTAPRESAAPASSGEPDAALDHAATKKAVMEAIRRTGVGNPVEPLQVSYHQSGKSPEDTYYFLVGCNGKVYGKNQKPPKGRLKRLAVSMGFSDRGWVCHAEISHSAGKYDELDASSDEVAQYGVLLASEQGRGFDSDKRNLERWRKFEPKDPFEAARAAIRDLYVSGHLYDVERKFRESPNEADARLKPLVRYIDECVRKMGSRYNAGPDNRARKTLIDAFVRNGVSRKGLEYADSWGGWLAVAWAQFVEQGGFYPAHRQALELSLQAFRAQGYARQSDLLFLERGMEEFKHTDEKVEGLFQGLVAAYADKARVLDDSARVTDGYWTAAKRLDEQRSSGKISVDEYFLLLRSEEKRRDAALSPLKSKEKAAAAEIGRIYDELRAIAGKRRYFQAIAKDTVRDYCEDAGK